MKFTATNIFINLLKYLIISNELTVDVYIHNSGPLIFKHCSISFSIWGVIATTKALFNRLVLSQGQSPVTSDALVHDCIFAFASKGIRAVWALKCPNFLKLFSSPLISQKYWRTISSLGKQCQHQKVV